MMNSSKWYFNSIFYQIYPQSFQDSNGDGIGDLKGIISRLDYLKDLGIDAIWLNPIYPSPFKDAGYDVADYKNIAPRYGNMGTFDRLIKEAHRRNIKIVLDLVFNHTSNEHPWFRQSQRMQKNRYSKWYVWNPPFRPIHLRTGSWEMWVSERYDSYYHQFTSYQPDLNFGFPDLPEEYGNSYNDPDVRALREELKSVVRFWLEREVDGFRCDVAEWLVQEKGKERTVHEYTARFWNEVREVIDSYGDKAFIAEGLHHVDDIARCRFNGSFFIPQTWRLLSPYPIGGEGELSWESFFSPEGGDLTWFVKEYFKEYEKVKNHQGIIHLISGSHDMSRISYICKKDEIIKAYFALLLTYPTAPFIYYGDEIGMQYQENLPSREGACFRAGSRTPMQWTDEKNAGFSSADSSKLYFPVNTDYKERNVEKQKTCSSSILNTVKKLISLRKSNSAFSPFAGIRHLHLRREDRTYIYSRYDEKNAFIVALNPSDTPRDLKVEVNSEYNELKGATHLVPRVSSREASKVMVEDNKLYFQFPANFFAVYEVMYGKNKREGK